MPLPHDTAIALGVERDGVNFRHCHSRSLMLDRLANPALDKHDRRDFFLNAFKKPPVRDRLAAWQSFLSSAVGPSADAILFAQLQSRLMVNMAGGVMENAGLCLDRFGVPYIAGSAVKGCARRMAIQSLLEAREAKEPTDKLARLLADIALVFGWGEQDWKTRQDIVSKLRPKRDDTDEVFAQRCQESWKAKRSDFAYAVGDGLWGEVATAAHMLLPNTDHFAGTVSFLPACPHHARRARHRRTQPRGLPGCRGKGCVSICHSTHPPRLGGACG
jgi:CRISPR/Cas system CMR subunit Cmr6 (Cas7 group RAMP superfamily)